ncbi:hypothetical protein HPB47_019573 [Ixodes persulcatus]|uniref:Uncharacterized protein n=1 Tax=Ixodes persulcatus TaxID=34615 RepID=A0AC60QJR9_IXOPE|nr:hypothetical protein HPB47_019573 [Ixodes persulcatus]
MTNPNRLANTMGHSMTWNTMKHPKAGSEHIVEAWKCDSNSLTLRAMPRITHCYLFPNTFETMRVNLAFHLLSEEVGRGLLLYHEQIKAHVGTSSCTSGYPP